MLDYTNTWWGLPLLGILRGSAIPRAVPFAVLAAIEGVVLELYANEYCEEKFSHPYAYQSFSSVLGFALVFRTNVAISRWWESCTNLVTMQSKWIDAAAQMMVFDGGQKEEAVRTRDLYRKAVLHLLSLAHAMQLQALRSDTEPLKFVEAHRADVAPPDDPGGSTASLKKEIGTRSVVNHISVIGRRRESTPEIEETTAGEAAPQDAQASSRPQSLQNLQLRWQRTTSSEQLQRIENSRKELRSAMLLHIFGLPHGEVYKNLRDMADPLGVIGGMAMEELAMLKMPSAQRQNIVHGWLVDLFAKRIRSGGLDIPPPILSRTMQVLSDGFLGGSHARKVAQTPFPFPHQQLITGLLVGFCLSIPLVVAAYMDGWGAVGMASGVTAGCYFAINEVGRDLEDPYNYVPNCVPLSKMQWDFNQQLWAITAGVDTTIMDITTLPWAGGVRLVSNCESSCGSAPTTPGGHESGQPDPASGFPSPASMLARARSQMLGSEFRKGGTES